MDAEGKPLRHAVREADGNLYLYSRLYGRKHFVSQASDVTVDTGASDPFDGNAVFNEITPYAMGRADGSASVGSGPLRSVYGVKHAPDGGWTLPASWWSGQ